jgi:ribosomal protein L37E
MSIETVCKKCGEEYDVRHGACPVCEPPITVKMRTAHYPFNTWDEAGWLPFEMHGERFAVTRIPCALDSPIRWRVSHVGTGVALPDTDSARQEEAKAKAIEVLTKQGAEKLKAALDLARRIIGKGDAEGRLPA